MKHLKTILMMIWLAAAAGSDLHGQSGMVERADQYFSERAWSKAIPLYERAVEKYNNMVLRSRLGTCYRNLGDYPMAEKWYGEALKVGGAGWYERINYGQMLKANGKYDQAIEVFRALESEAGPDQITTLIQPNIDACLSVKKLAKDSVAWKIFPVEGINTPGSEICPAVLTRGIVFISDRGSGGPVRFTNTSTDRAFYGLFFAERYAGAKFINTTPLKGDLNSRLHDGPVTFSAAEDRAFITRSTDSFRHKPGEQEGGSRLTLISYRQEAGKWMQDEMLPFVGSEFSFQHPSLSRDGEWLCFSSDMPGGFGGYDLYVSHWNETGKSWSVPVNMGPSVNSSFNEAFPFLQGDTVVYFASDRPGGFGGLDIFSSEKVRGVWSRTTNAGPPMNSSYDDFGIVFERNGYTGFFTSNRPGGVGNDDIYSFRRYKTLDCIVQDARSGELMIQTVVEVIDINQRKFIYRTDDEGRFRHSVTSGEDVVVMVKKEDYVDYRKSVDMRLSSASGVRAFKINLEPDKRFVLRGTITDAKTEYPLVGASVRLISDLDVQIKSGRGGLYQNILEPMQDYTVIIGMPGYIPELRTMTTRNDTQPKVYRIDGVLKKGNYLLLEGQVFDRDRKTSLDSAEVKIISAATLQEVYRTRTHDDGMFWAVLPPGTYSIVAQRQTFFSSQIEITSSTEQADTQLIKIELMKMQVEKIVRTVYHPYSQTTFDSLARAELDALVTFMINNPDAQVELSSHTDSRGTDSYNLKLSQERANKVADYLVSKGIARERVFAKGYGETRLTNGCANGKECSDELHSLNRRTELKVLRIQPGAPEHLQPAPPH